jgi:thiol-disulfide isomerase/thioredoxin
VTKLKHTFIIVGVAVAAAITGALYRWSEVAEAPPDANAAPKLWALSLPDLAQKRHPLNEWRGKVLVVNFWATWCPPCREEIPGFVRMSQKYSNSGVQFVGISIDSADKVRDFAAQYAINYPLLIGDSAALQIASAFGNRAQGLPFTIILDRSGATRRVRLGQLEEHELDTILAKMM